MKKIVRRISTSGVARERSYSTATFDYVKDCYFKVIEDKYPDLDFVHFEMMVNTLFEYVKDKLDDYYFKKIYLQGFCYWQPQDRRIKISTTRLGKYLEKNKDYLSEDLVKKYHKHLEICKEYIEKKGIQ